MKSPGMHGTDLTTSVFDDVYCPNEAVFSDSDSNSNTMRCEGDTATSSGYSLTKILIFFFSKNIFISNLMVVFISNSVRLRPLRVQPVHLQQVLLSTVQQQRPNR